MNLANIITIIRIILVPIFLVILLTKLENKEIVAFSIFVIASISDVLDGYIARKYNQITNLGKLLDPLADKFLTIGALIALFLIGTIEAWIVVLILIREVFITIFRYYLLSKSIISPASFMGKIKTFFQIISIATLLIYSVFPKPYDDYFYKVGLNLLYFALFLTIYSGLEYIIKHSITKN